jgi:hypothetical protein
VDDRLFQCVWSSRVGEPLSATAFAALAERADRRHRLRGVTGCLARDEAVYLGLLEGGRAVVGELLAAIARDPRHRAVRVLWDGPGRRRVFPGTALAVADLAHGEAAPRTLTDLLDTLPRDAHCPRDVRRALAAVRTRAAVDAGVVALSVH